MRGGREKKVKTQDLDLDYIIVEFISSIYIYIYI